MNEPLPHQMTVGQLRQLLAEVPDTTVVGFALLPVRIRGHLITQLINVEAVYNGGPTLLLRPNEKTPDDHHPRRLDSSIKSCLYWFIEDVVKGLLEYDQWDFDIEMFEDGRLSWDRYISAITDPTVLKTAVTLWSNNLELNDNGFIVNEAAAAFRAFQYLRTQFDDAYTANMIRPPLADWELEEEHFVDGGNEEDA
ncbi:MAG: hypothetical protein NXI04_30145 [Planctomycetaceae bacterium]|nr:hypothetical protein [Planctomycetaceae bacterium]